MLRRRRFRLEKRGSLVSTMFFTARSLRTKYFFLSLSPVKIIVPAGRRLAERTTLFETGLPFPIHHDCYGVLSAPREFERNSGTVLEILFSSKPKAEDFFFHWCLRDNGNTCFPGLEQVIWTPRHP